MRAGLSTIQQTLTPEAASVLNQSIAEAGRRNHGQTTPLHVAAMLLASQSGFLRQACIRSHPNSSHPLQCRALELCFSVALERLPTAAQPTPPSSSTSTAAGSPEPPISNALMAALKRAQAHQRRGCPEQQQQPLLAVKVELEQLVISILDDPSVSRVMREASFSSPAVKATIEQTLISAPQQPAANASAIGLGFRSPPRNLYLNPRLQQTRSSDDVGRVIDILTRSRKRNPVLVGDAEPVAVMKSVLKRIENRESGDGVLKGVVEVVSLETHLGSNRTNLGLRIKELGDLVGARIGSGSVVLDLGDLKWLVESSLEEGQAAVAEMGKLLDSFRDGNNGSCRLWLIGVAMCETYLRCQVYHTSMENDWDLQAVPIAARAPQPPTGFSRLGPPGILGRSFENVNPLKIENIPRTATNAPQKPRAFSGTDLSLRTSCCPQCTQNYEEDLAKLVAEESENSSKPEPAAKQPLPPWLQIARAQVPERKSPDGSQTKDREEICKQKIQELQKKWLDTCLHHGSSLGSEQVIPVTLGLCSSNLISRVPLHVPPKLYARKRIDENLQLSHTATARQPSEQPSTPPRSPVRTELVLGQTKQSPSETNPEKAYKESLKPLGYISSKTQQSRLPELQQSNTVDVDLLKRLLKGLVQKVWWQQEAASAAAASAIQFRLGRRKPSAATDGVRSRVDMWLMFLGPDRIGKRKVASILSQELCGTRALILRLGSRSDSVEEPEAGFRGKTVLDRIVEAVKRNPSSVIMLEDVDEADVLLCRSIKHAMEMGRLVDSHGREVSLGSIIFILTAKWVPKSENITDLKASSLDDAKLANLARGSWQLRLSVCKKSNKRQANWLQEDEHRGTKLRKDITSTLAFDLNESAANAEDDIMDGSHNSSDLTFDHEDELGLEMKRLPAAAPALPQLLNSVEEAIVFKPVDLGAVRRQMESFITSKFTAVTGNALLSIEVDDKALEKIVGGVWHGGMELEEWTERVLIPNFHHLKAMLPSSVEHEATSNVVVRLEPDGDSGDRCAGEWLPSNIKVVVLDELGR